MASAKVTKRSGHFVIPGTHPWQHGYLTATPCGHGCRFEECSQIWTQTTDYFQVVGIILGQLTVGFLGDWLGRRWGMIQVSASTLLVCKHCTSTRLVRARLVRRSADAAHVHTDRMLCKAVHLVTLFDWLLYAARGSAISKCSWHSVSISPSISISWLSS